MVNLKSDRFLLADIFLFIVYILAIFVPLLLELSLPTSVFDKVDVKYAPVINGVITVSGVLFAFLATTVATRTKPVPKLIYAMLIINVFIFYYVAADLLFATIGGGSFLPALVWSIAAFNANFVTAGALISLIVMSALVKRRQTEPSTKKEDEQKSSA
jgi:hypothetical protein